MSYIIFRVRVEPINDGRRKYFRRLVGRKDGGLDGWEGGRVCVCVGMSNPRPLMFDTNDSFVWMGYVRNGLDILVQTVSRGGGEETGAKGRSRHSTKSYRVPS